MNKEAIESIVKEVLEELDVDSVEDLSEEQAKKAKEKVNNSLEEEIDSSDYPLGKKRPDDIETPTGKKLDDITLEKVLSGEIKDEDLRITEETLDKQAQIASQEGRDQFADNLKRAGELTRVPDDRILEIYESLRPKRSTKQELLDIAEELETEYKASINADLIREAAEVYEERGLLSE